jgi:type IV pilus assembly protein PilM
LAKHDELSSTERLLKIIRDEGPAEANEPAFGPLPSAGSRIRNFVSDSVPISRKSIAVGVDLGHEDLKLVMLNRSSESKTELIDYARIELDPQIPKEHPDFPRFIRSTLLDFCGPQRNVQLWATISSARVETRHIKIPKVPQKQIANSVFWSYQRQSPFKDSDTIFDFEVLGEAEEGGVRKLSVMAFIAPRQEVEDLKSLFARAGFALKGVSIVPFAVQTLLRSQRVRSYGAAVSCLYIGREWSRIDIFADDSLVLSRGIKAGMRTMTDALQKEIEENWLELSLAKSPTSDPNRIRAIKQRLKQELDISLGLFFGPIHGAAPAATEPDKQLAAREERIFQMIRPALERMVRQVERTIRHFALNFDNARVEKIYVSSGVRPHPRILDYIGDELGLPIEVINPFAGGPELAALKPLPDSVAEQSAFAPAMGMAMATNAITPNFLFTYKDKKAVATSQRVNRSIGAVFALLTLLVAGVAFWQEQQIREKELQKHALQTQLGAFQVRVDRNLILKLVDQIRAKNQGLQGVGSNFIGVGVLGEVANITPANVRLLTLNAKLNAAPKPAAAGAKIEPAKKLLVMDGIISGERMNLESELAAYLMMLKTSPLFKQPAITRKAFETFDNKPVIRFTAQMELV